MKIIIPARLGSKGFPFKNRELFKYTADIIPPSLHSSVYVTSNDEEILNSLATNYHFNKVIRPEDISQDESSIKDVIIDCIEQRKNEFSYSEEIIMLYLTYPTRTWDHVTDALELYRKYNSVWATNSLLCKKEVKVNPYLCLREHGGIYGRQLVSHDLYRRQDYPKCFELSHYISIFNSASIYSLGNNLYSDNTIFYPISDVVDVDYKKDINNLYGAK